MARLAGGLVAAAAAQGHGRWAAGLVVGLGIALGALRLLLADRVAPHVRPMDPARGGQARSLHRAWVLVAAISLHTCVKAWPSPGPTPRAPRR